MSEDNRLIVVERPEPGVARVVIDNPPLNLVTLEMTEQLIVASRELEGDASVRAVVVTGSGERAFCAGADIKEFVEVRDRVIEKKLQRENEGFGSLESLSKPVIAAIEGVALGGGCEIALACDLRIVGESARIGLPEIKLGVFPGSGGLFRLPKLVGQARALELLYLGEPVGACEAERIGLVNKVVPDGEAVSCALELARELVRRPKEAVAAIKSGVRESLLLSTEEAVDLTLKLSDRVFRSGDLDEGVAAFFEKRPPRFEGAPDTLRGDGKAQ